MPCFLCCLRYFLSVSLGADDRCSQKCSSGLRSGDWAWGIHCHVCGNIPRQFPITKKSLFIFIAAMMAFNWDDWQICSDMSWYSNGLLEGPGWPHSTVPPPHYSNPLEASQLRDLWASVVWICSLSFQGSSLLPFKLKVTDVLTWPL